MVEMTVQVPDELAQRIRPIRSWLPAILELGLVGFRTLATETASEIVEFLLTGPSPQDVLDYEVSERGQSRLRRLLALNRAGELGEGEQLELDELEQVEHIMVMLKAQLAAQARQGA